LKNTAVNNNTPYQVEVSPFTTGTDAGAIQMGEGGVITALLSVPLKYMHSTVETISLKDIESCAKLISDYIIGINNGKWEETLCF
jgi:endoglucanase